MKNGGGTGRRNFLRQVAVGVGASQASPGTAPAPPQRTGAAASPQLSFPRRFTGQHLARIAFPLGGVAAGSVSLGGRGQLCDWEIFNRPNKGFTPDYALASIWAKAGAGKPVARVLESRILPPYEGADGLGSKNAPGLPRLASATFIGQYPLARIEFEDAELPVEASLDAFSPFIPLDPDNSGLPVALLRYRVRNRGSKPASVSIAFSLDNPVRADSAPRGAASAEPHDGRENSWRTGAAALAGFVMSNSALDASHPLRGTLALAVMPPAGAHVTHWAGWPQGRWWNSPLHFWDRFSASGQLDGEPEHPGLTAAVCLNQTIEAGHEAVYPFLLAWHFPNRTPAWCGWSAPPGHNDTVIGNYYCTRFADAWAAAEYSATHLDSLERRTRTFAATFARSTLPAAVKDAASANLSTLATTTCFRTADGAFHGFEGVNDQSGCCFGNCTHVWNYETATAHLFPTFARSLREAAFGYSMDGAGAIHFRQLLPDGIARSGFAAADGQMGQILHAYLDWLLSGDNDWLRAIWPRLRKALEFAWIPGGWDANRDGVMEGVQHNTYDVEFYGPNPQCGIYYLGALRAASEMARAVGDNGAAAVYQSLFERGRNWIDANLFNGKFYIQQTRGFAAAEIAPALRSDMGSENTEHPEYQVGQGCLVDQLVGQYLAEVAGLGPLLDPAHIHCALQSIYEYNYKRTLYHHECVERTFALNGESALVICDYGSAPRPNVPFPYFGEVMTGFEYSTAALMIFAGMEKEGVECIANIRARYDGEKRNPWDEAECGHHYARAMAAWSAVLAASGFRYHGAQAAVTAAPPVAAANFRCFWSAASGWGEFSLARGAATNFELRVIEGRLACRSVTVPARTGAVRVALAGQTLPHTVRRQTGILTAELTAPVTIPAGGRLTLRIGA
jgi:non-lysosomal glucosylceramidase